MEAGSFKKIIILKFYFQYSWYKILFLYGHQQPQQTKNLIFLPFLFGLYFQFHLIWIYYMNPFKKYSGQILLQKKSLFHILYHKILKEYRQTFQKVVFPHIIIFLINFIIFFRDFRVNYQLSCFILIYRSWYHPHV